MTRRAGFRAGDGESDGMRHRPVGLSNAAIGGGASVVDNPRAALTSDGGHFEFWCSA